MENDEDFTVTLSNPSAPATITTAVATGTIQNDDSTTLAIARSTPTSAVKDEGNSGTTPFTFTVTRSGDRSGSTTVNYAVSKHASQCGLIRGSLPTGTVTFGPNDASQVITINVSGDTLVENDEDFTVTLSNPSAPATITTAVATGTIQNDDSTTLAIARSTPTSAVKDEGNSGTTPFTFTVTRSGDRSGSTTVSDAVSSTQANAADFGGSFPTGTVTFGPNDASQVITINVSGDTLVENDEDFTVTLNKSVGAGHDHHRPPQARSKTMTPPRWRSLAPRRHPQSRMKATAEPRRSRSPSLARATAAAAPRSTTRSAARKPMRPTSVAVYQPAP